MAYSGRLMPPPAHRRAAPVRARMALPSRPVVGWPKMALPATKVSAPASGHAADVVDLDAAVDLQPDVAAAGVDQLARLFDLAQRAVDEALRRRSPGSRS
jgi:hypothetical protein